MPECGSKRSVRLASRREFEKSGVWPRRFAGPWPGKASRQSKHRRGKSLARPGKECHKSACKMNQAIPQLALIDRPLRRSWGLLFLAAFLVLQLCASSGALHQSLHSDASAPDHHCAITLLTGGQMSAPILPAIWIAFAAALFFSLPPPLRAAHSTFDHRFSGSRAPPRF